MIKYEGLIEIYLFIYLRPTVCRLFEIMIFHKKFLFFLNVNNDFF